MSEAHRIRLRGPWEVTALDGVPGTRHIRRFGRPGQLDAGERVWLVIEPCATDVAVALNDAPIGAAPANSHFEADITSLLSARNKLHIDVLNSNALTGEVRLEIRPTDHAVDVPS